MASASADPLRSTLDNLQLDPRSEADRPYLVAMLRRLGYTERQIDEVVRTGEMPTEAPAQQPDDGLAPPRDYRLVVPARDSRFELESAAPPATDSPFEDLERVEFESPPEEVEFETVTEFEPAPDERAESPGGEDLQWQDADTGEPVPEDAAWQTTEEGAPEEGFGGGALQEQAAGPAPSFEEGAIDTFGNPDASMAGGPKTRVRVRRVRAASREEAERKVAGEGRNVIKSVPVDIVERWGANAASKPKAPAEGDEEEA
jgi:hypothetical protein